MDRQAAAKSAQLSDFYGGSSAGLCRRARSPRHLDEDDHFFRGVVAGRPAQTFPMPLTMALMKGQERFNIHCRGLPRGGRQRLGLWCARIFGAALLPHRSSAPGPRGSLL